MVKGQYQHHITSPRNQQLNSYLNLYIPTPHIPLPPLLDTLHLKALHQHTPSHRPRRKIKNRKPKPRKKLPIIIQLEIPAQPSEIAPISAIPKARGPLRRRSKRRRNIRLHFEPHLRRATGEIAGRGNTPRAAGFPPIRLVEREPCYVHEFIGGALAVDPDVGGLIAEEGGAGAVAVGELADVEAEGGC